MKKPKSLNDCDRVEDAIKFVLNSEDKKKIELAKKLSELLEFPMDMRFKDRIERYFKEAINDPSLSDFTDEEIHGKARELAFKIFQIYVQRSFLAVQRSVKNARY